MASFQEKVVDESAQRTLDTFLSEYFPQMTPTIRHS